MALAPIKLNPENFVVQSLTKSHAIGQISQLHHNFLFSVCKINNFVLSNVLKQDYFKIKQHIQQLWSFITICPLFHDFFFFANTQTQRKTIIIHSQKAGGTKHIKSEVKIQVGRER